jgi:hypothetical protein
MLIIKNGDVQKSLIIKRHTIKIFPMAKWLIILWKHSKKKLMLEIAP